MNPPSTEPDSGPSTSTANTELAKPGVAEAELTDPLAPAEVLETVDTLLLPLPVQDANSDIDDRVLVLDSDDSKSDWSEIEN